MIGKSKSSRVLERASSARYGVFVREWSSQPGHWQSDDARSMLNQGELLSSDAQERRHVDARYFDWHADAANVGATASAEPNEVFFWRAQRLEQNIQLFAQTLNLVDLSEFDRSRILDILGEYIEHDARAIAALCIHKSKACTYRIRLIGELFTFDLHVDRLGARKDRFSCQATARFFDTRLGATMGDE